MHDIVSAGGDGTSWTFAHKYLQDALADAEYGDEIWVAEGTYKPDQGSGVNEGNRTASFNLVNGVGIYGGFLGVESSRDPQGDYNQTILSGEIDQNSSLWSIHVVKGTNLDTNSSLDGFRITMGNANGSSGSGYNQGGGMMLKNVHLSFTNLVIANNSAVANGAGIYSDSSNLILTDCVFTGNDSGGSDGGGVYSIYGSLNLTNCVFSLNSAPRMGGGIYFFSQDSSESMFSLTNCIFTENSNMGYIGGGIAAEGDAYSLTLTNCILTKNSGGGIYSDRTFTLINSILRGNISFPGVFEPGFDNSTVEGHGMSSNVSWSTYMLEEAVPEQYFGDPNDGTFQPNLNILQGWDGDARGFDADPLFVNIDDPVGPDGKWFTADDGLRVILGSPAIDAGYNDALPADSSDLDGDGNLTEAIPFDVMGFNRRQGSSVDIGAYESDPVFLSGQAAVTANPSAFNLITKSTHEQALLDANASAEQAIADAKINAKAEGIEEGKTLGKSEGESSVTSNPSAYNLVTQSTYDEMMNELMEVDDNATPYTEGWFYHSSGSWMWTTRSAYPYFFDSQSESWMYFQSGNEKPRFYHFGTKEWMTVE